jgi:hypothetical protein
VLSLFDPDCRLRLAWDADLLVELGVSGVVNPEVKRFPDTAPRLLEGHP